VASARARAGGSARERVVLAARAWVVPARQRASPLAEGSLFSSEACRHPKLAAANASTSAASPQRPAIALAGGMGATVILPRGSAVLHLHVAVTRSFSTTPRRQACEPAPNVASDAETASPDGVADALTTLADPAVYGWWPSSFAELGVVALHEATGLPWWQCIAGITLAVRTMLFPLVIYQVPPPTFLVFQRGFAG
jgi:hypothetical protein